MTKLTNDAASMVACTLSDYMTGNFNLDAFQKATRQNFPYEVALHIENVVYKAIVAHKNHLKDMHEQMYIDMSMSY